MVGRGLQLGAAWLFLALTPAAAQEAGVLGEESYITPAPEIARIVTAPRHENVTLIRQSPDRRHLLNTISTGQPTLEDLARPHYNLGGLYIDHRANRARSLTTGTTIGFEVVRVEDGRKIEIEVPKGARVSSPQWSPDGKSLAYFAHFPEATYIYVADVSNGKSRRLTGTPVLATLVTDFYWVDGGSAIIAVLVPERRGAEPQPSALPNQPMVVLTQEGENKLRTFPSLLQNRYEQDLLEYHITGQLARIDASRGRVQKIGDPAMIRDIDPSPRGDYVRVTTIEKPFSYIVPVSRFGRVEEIWDLEGKVLAELDKRPINDGSKAAADDDQDSTKVDDNRRKLAWRPDGEGLSYLQLAPKPEGRRRSGDSAEKRKDRVMQWLPPFDSTSARVVYESDEEIRDVQYTRDPRLIIVSEREDRRLHRFALNLDDPGRKNTITRHRTANFYSNPGTLLTVPDPRGPQSGVADLVHLSSDGGSVYLTGTRHSRKMLEEAPRPFIDRVEIATGKKQRIFESRADKYERFRFALDDDLDRVVITRESATEVPDYFVRDLRAGGEKRLTKNVDHSPEITRARREIIEVTRADGIKFWVRVTYPQNYKEGERLPALFWFYPREYVSQAAYNRTKRTYNKNQFPRIGPRSMEIMTAAGYVVVQPDAPIVGPRGRMNDNYIHDLRNNLSATIDELDRRGIIDRTKLALGGHSYGAFSTVNAMVSTPFFKAGIAGAGNFNRTLTPFAFQRERRELWEARDTYLEMSPFLQAHRLTGALLLYHGMDDQNVGTFPINSPRLFHALNGLGKTAALYMYPYEGHGPASRETLLDLWARWVAWLDTHLKGEGEKVAGRMEDQ